MIKEDSKTIILSIIGIAILFVTVIGITYAVFSFTSNGRVENKLTTGHITMNYTESSNVISITNAEPTSDLVGRVSNDYFDFSINTEIGGNMSINYEVRAEKLSVNATPIADSDIKIYLEKLENGSYVSKMEPTYYRNTEDSVLSDDQVNKNTMLLYRGVFSNNANDVKSFEDDFRLRMWLSSDAELDENKREFKLRVNVYSSTNS